MENYVRYQFQAAVEMYRKRGGIDAGFLLGGESVEFTTDTVDAVEDMPGAPMIGTFEDRMLNEMSHTFIVTHFVTRADINIKTGMSDRRAILPDDDF